MNNIFTIADKNVIGEYAYYKVEFELPDEYPGPIDVNFWETDNIHEDDLPMIFRLEIDDIEDIELSAPRDILRLYGRFLINQIVNHYRVSDAEIRLIQTMIDDEADRAAVNLMGI